MATLAVVHRLVALGTGVEIAQGWAGIGSSAAFTHDEGDGFLSKLGEECKDGVIHFGVDEPDARGRLPSFHQYSPNILVNGVMCGYVDLFEGSENGNGLPAQMLFFTPEDDDEALAKVFVEDGKMVVIVHKDAESLTSHSRALHHYGDHIYHFVEDAPRAAEVAQEPP